MKKDRINRMIEGIDEKYIEEANPEAGAPKADFSKKYIWTNIAASVCAVLLAVNIAIIVPLFHMTPDDSPVIPGGDGGEQITGTQSGENGGGAILPDDPGEGDDGGKVPTYPSEGEEDEEITVQRPTLSALPDRFKDIENKLLALVDKDFIKDELEDLEDQVSSESSKEESGSYVETTDNQVLGVKEGDLLKRTDTHLFYLNGTNILVYEINDIASKSIATISIAKEIERVFKTRLPAGFEGKNQELDEILTDEEDTTIWQMFLSDDGKTLTVLADASDVCTADMAVIVSVDVTNPVAPKIKGTRSVLGNLISSRMIDGQLVVFTEYIPFKDEGGLNYAFIPMIDKGQGFEYIDADKIAIPNSFENASFTVITKISESDLSVKDACAYLDITSDPFVSKGNIYLARQKEATDEALSVIKTVSEIAVIEIGQSHFNHKGIFTVDGYVKDQYSFDEKDGVLRVVTTLSDHPYVENESGDALDTIRTTRTNAALYCIDIKTGAELCVIKNFAPDGETVQSVRFDENKAYVCTAVIKTFTDPVYFIDLTDLSNPQIDDTGTIDGYSSSLVSLKNGYLLGIGFGGSGRTLKIEVYKRTDEGVISVAKLEQENIRFSEEYKAYYIDKEKGLIGFGYTKGIVQGYMLLKFNEETEAIETILDTQIYGSYNLKRAVIIDNYLYILGQAGLYVRKVF